MPLSPKTNRFFLRLCILVVTAGAPPLGLLGQAPSPTRAASASVPLPVTKPVADSIANAAIVLAAQRLSFNPSDSTAQKLLKLTDRLSPNNERSLYVKGLLQARRPIPPGVFGNRVDENAFAKYMLDLAEKQKRPSYFRILCYNVAQLFQPTNRTIIVALHKARKAGAVTDYDNVLTQLYSPYPKLHPSANLPPPALPELVAKKLADGAIGMALRELNLNRQSIKGMDFIRFAQAIHPANENAQLIEALLTADQPLTGIFIQVDDQAFIAELKQSITTAKDPNLLLLLHAMVLLHDPTNFQSVVYMQRAKQANLPTSFSLILGRFNQARNQALRPSPNRAPRPTPSPF